MRSAPEVSEAWASTGSSHTLSVSVKPHRSSGGLSLQVGPAGVQKHLVDLQLVWSGERFLGQGPGSCMTLTELLRLCPGLERFSRLPPGKDYIRVARVHRAKHLVRDESR